MGGIAAVYNLDGRPIDRLSFDRMLSAIAHRGPDGMGRWVDGPIALGHTMLHTTPESLHDTQPLAGPDGNHCLTFDGRIDNRTELIAALEANGVRLRTDTDSEIILRAYECWGEDSPRRIIGDFAFALWDGCKHELVCVRDPCGIKPFYYYCDGRMFICGSEIQQLLEDPRVRREPNEGLIGEYLTGTLLNREETLYRHIFRLTPAHFLVVRRGGAIVKRRYYDLDPGRKIRYRTNGEYAEHFREIFREAVRCQMRSSNAAVAAELSGGLDSSSVVGMAQSLLQGGAFPDYRFETFSLVFSDPGCDERNYIDDVVRMWNLKANLLEGFMLDLPTCLGLVHRYKEFLDYPNGASFNTLKSLVAQKGFRFILTGLGGDQWFTGTDYYCADLLLQFRLIELVRRLRTERGRTYGRSPLGVLLKQGIQPIVPGPVRRAIKKWVLRRDPYPPTINREFARRIGLADRLKQRPKPPRRLSFAQREVYDAFAGAFIVHGIEMEERESSSFGLEERHPFYDRRLLEFAFAIPEDQRYGNDRIKFVMRQAMGGLMPQSVCQRVAKAEFSQVVLAMFENVGAEKVFDSLTLESLGWVNGDEVRKMYRNWRENRKGRELWALWAILGVELWFNEAFDAEGSNRRRA